MYRVKLELIQNYSDNFPHSDGPENIDLPKIKRNLVLVKIDLKRVKSISNEIQQS